LMDQRQFFLPNQIVNSPDHPKSTAAWCLLQLPDALIISSGEKNQAAMGKGVLTIFFADSKSPTFADKGVSPQCSCSCFHCHHCYPPMGLVQHCLHSLLHCLPPSHPLCWHHLVWHS
jgi:hypothetical protein